MKVKLTDTERCVLGFDDPGYRREMEREDYLIADVLPKLDGRHELTERELEALRQEVEQLPLFGASPQTTSTARRLRRKLRM